METQADRGGHTGTRGAAMVMTRDSLVAVLRELGEHDKACEAVCCLPRIVDTDRDALRLHEFGLSTQVLQDALV